jgi:hypothetical protein
MKQIITLLLGTTAALGMALMSCTGGGNPIVPAESDALLGGTITVVGAPLADLDNPDVIGEQDAGKWSVRVIDPTESVDVIEIEHGDTTITPLALDLLGDYLLRIEILPAVDLSGGSADVTPVLLDLLVPASTAIDTVVTANIELVPPQDASASRVISQAAGYRLLISYTVTGEHASAELIELDWNGYQIRRDTNSNGLLDDEVYFPDSDRNGLSDNRQQGIQGGSGGGQVLQISGVVDAVHHDLSSITVDGHVLLVDETTVITSSENAAITLSEIVVGQSVAVTAHKGKFGNIYAASIQVLAD